MEEEMATMSRQVRRQIERRAAKSEASRAKVEARKVARRERLERQTAREKAGFYDSLPCSVAQAVTPSRSRIHTRKVSKGKPHGRILPGRTGFSAAGRELELHATKGWRTA
jgi:hypothetical protein